MKRRQNQANMSSQFGAEGHNFSVENQPWFLTCTERTCQRRMHTREHGFWKYRQHQVDLESRALHNLELALSHWQLVRFLPSTPAPFPPRLLLSIWLRCLGLDSARCSWLRLLSLSLSVSVSRLLSIFVNTTIYIYIRPPVHCAVTPWILTRRRRHPTIPELSYTFLTCPCASNRLWILDV